MDSWTDTDSGIRYSKEGERFWTKGPVVFLAAFICCFLWGSASPSIKIGYRLFAIDAGDIASRILFAGMRFTLAGIMVIAFLALRSLSEGVRTIPKPQKGSWRYVLVLMTFQTVLQYIFFYTGLAHTSGVRGSIINACGTFISIFLSVFLFHFEKLTPAKITGSILGFLGILIILTGGFTTISTASVTFAGEGCMVIAVASSSLAGCFIKLFSRHEDPAVLSGWQFLLGGLVMIFLGLLLGGSLHPASGSAWLLLLYMGFISAGAYTLWSILLKFNDVSKITIMGFMNPVLGVLLSALFLHEENEAFSLSTLAALLLLGAGIFISSRRKKAS